METNAATVGGVSTGGVLASNVGWKRMSQDFEKLKWLCFPVVMQRTGMVISEVENLVRVKWGSALRAASGTVTWRMMQWHRLLGLEVLCLLLVQDRSQ